MCRKLYWFLNHEIPYYTSSYLHTLEVLAYIRFVTLGLEDEAKMDHSDDVSPILAASNGRPQISAIKSIDYSEQEGGSSKNRKLASTSLRSADDLCNVMAYLAIQLSPFSYLVIGHVHY